MHNGHACIDFKNYLKKYVLVFISILTPHLLSQILKIARKCQYCIPTLEALLKI